MKLMKHITIALVLSAIPAMAFGQTVSCDDCTHSISVYMGEGGLIATAAGDAEKVTYVATCNGVTRTGEMTAGDDGIVSMLLDTTNSLACANPDEDSKFELGPIMDGGWFWVTDDMNSAVGNLVDMDVIKMNETTDLTSAGAGVTMTEGMGAVFIKETATGRVGILPNILPEPDVPATPATACGMGAKGGATPKVGAKTNCMLGAGETMVTVSGPTGYSTGEVTSVVRPYTGSVTISAELWHTSSGRYAVADADAILGRTGGAALAASFTASFAPSTAVPYGTPTLTEGGVAPDSGNSDANTQAWTISPNATYCGTSTKPLNNALKLTIVADMDDGEVAKFIPNLVNDADSATTGDQTATASVTIMCPSGASSSATQGVELVPENLFPTE